MNPKNEPAKGSVSISRDAGHSSGRPVCFVLMPISDPSDCVPGHFERVYVDIFKPACEKAGFEPIRASDVRQANLIHLDILQKLLESPMALCDLSTRNPNVLFELGLRQAFDMPVALVREVGTPDIFDIAPLRYAEYRSERLYHEVVEDQQEIASVLKETKEAFDKGQGINSIVRLLSITQAAQLVDVQEVDKDPILQLVRAELSELRTEFKEALDSRPSTSEQAPVSRTRSSLSNEHRARRDLAILQTRLNQIRDNLAHLEQVGEEREDLREVIRFATFRCRTALRRAEDPVTRDALDALSQELAFLRRLYEQVRSRRVEERRAEDIDDVKF